VKHFAGAGQRGNTLAELLIAMVVLAIVMSLAAWEVQSIVGQHNFAQSHLDAEEQARIAMSRMTEAIKQSSVDISDFNPPAGPVISPTATPTSAIQYYQVAGLTPDALPTSASGAPVPCYNVVTLQYQPPAPFTTEGSVEEYVAPAASPCPRFTYPPAAVVAENVNSFNVVPVQGAGVPTYQLNLTITAQLQTALGTEPGQYSLSETIVPLVSGKSQ
jgi:prepilin-type N-terminal cleavage/methylation domain-containing protein